MRPPNEGTEEARDAAAAHDAAACGVQSADASGPAPARGRRAAAAAAGAAAGAAARGWGGRRCYFALLPPPAAPGEPAGANSQHTARLQVPLHEGRGRDRGWRRQLRYEIGRALRRLARPQDVPDRAHTAASTVIAIDDSRARSLPAIVGALEKLRPEATSDATWTSIAETFNKHSRFKNIERRIHAARIHPRLQVCCAISENGRFQGRASQAVPQDQVSLRNVRQAPAPAKALLNFCDHVYGRTVMGYELESIKKNICGNS